MPMLDIVIPVYNEGGNILPFMASLRASVRTPFRIFVCYDHEEDSTLVALREAAPASLPAWVPVRNAGSGAHAAVLTGLRASTAPAVLVMPADDLINAVIIDELVRRFEDGCDVAVPSRFMRGGEMTGFPFHKALFVRVASLTLYYLGRLPVHDATNGFRLFSRRVLEIPIESSKGFSYSIELLAKCHRLGWRISEIPAVVRERTHGKSRFRLWGWLPEYLRWYRYIFATTWLGRRSECQLGGASSPC